MPLNLRHTHNIFLHLKLSSEAFQLKLNTFFTSSNGLANFDVKNIMLQQIKIAFLKKALFK